MSFVDLSFRVVGQSLPLDHGYALYAAVSRVLGPELHESNGIGIFAVRGLPVGDGLLRLDDHSRLMIRTHTDYIPKLLGLAGKQLDVDGHRFRIGVPVTCPIVPAARLVSRVVVIKLAEPRTGDGDLPGLVTPEAFLESLRKKLYDPPPAGLGLSREVEAAIPLRRSGPHAGEPTRRVLRIKDKKVVGYAVMLSGLTAEESVKVQEEGVGGRRHMGCGLFLPARNGEERS